VWVQRGVIPHWYDIACKANKGDTKAQHWLTDNAIHASETSWAGADFDAVINNNGRIDELYGELRTLVQDPMASKANGIYKPLADSLSILS